MSIVSVKYRIRIGGQFISAVNTVARGSRVPGITLSDESAALLFDTAYDASRTVDSVTSLNDAVTQQIEQVTLSQDVITVPYEAEVAPSPTPEG